MTIANVTATKDDETLENAADIKATDLAALLDYADEVLVHEVHQEEWVEDRKARYPEEWAEKVTMLAEPEDNPADDEDCDVGPTCRNANCDETATQKAVCDQGQEKHYCDDHAGGHRAGHAPVEEWVSL
jgi:hypothetical protein